MTNPPFILQHLDEIAAVRWPPWHAARPPHGQALCADGPLLQPRAVTASPADCCHVAAAPAAPAPAAGQVLAHPCVFSYLHVPVQSGSDAVLAAMKREYTAAGEDDAARQLLAMHARRRPRVRPRVRLGWRPARLLCAPATPRRAVPVRATNPRRASVPACCAWASEFRRVADTLLAGVPGLALATDIIAGFPGGDQHSNTAPAHLAASGSCVRMHACMRVCAPTRAV